MAKNVAEQFYFLKFATINNRKVHGKFGLFTLIPSSKIRR